MMEKEKVLKGQNYDSRDPELINMYPTLENYSKKYNFLDSNLIEEKAGILIE